MRAVRARMLRKGRTKKEARRARKDYARSVEPRRVEAARAEADAERRAPGALIVDERAG